MPMKTRTAKPKDKTESHYQEIVRKYISKKCGCAAVRELNLGGPKFDVVGFSPETDEFHIVECKRTSKAVGIGQTFGQILAYKALISEAGNAFLDAFEKQLVTDHISNIRFWNHGARFAKAGKIPVRFYVALLDRACERPEILQLIKRDLQGVGIIRVNRYDHCRDYIRVFREKDYTLCEASTVEIPISMPLRDDLKAVLDHRKSKPAVSVLAAKFDSKITAIKKKKVIGVRRRSEGIIYRAGENSAELWPHQNHLIVRVKGKNGWKRYRVETSSHLSRVLRAAKTSLATLA
jgi:hypothetical protein